MGQIIYKIPNQKSRPIKCCCLHAFEVDDLRNCEIAHDDGEECQDGRIHNSVPALEENYGSTGSM